MDQQQLRKSHDRLMNAKSLDQESFDLFFDVHESALKILRRENNNLVKVLASIQEHMDRY